MQVDPSIFRSYDIRGIAGQEFSLEAVTKYEKWYGQFPGITITPPIAQAIGKAYGTLIREKGGKHIVIGHEMRQGGEELKQLFMQGAMSAGLDVIDIGASLTPFVYFAIEYYGFDGGVSVTGSHSVYFFNGFKLMGRHVQPIYAEELQSLREIVQNETFRKDSPGKLAEKDILPEYTSYLLSHNQLYRKLKIVIDSGNGTAGVFAPQIFAQLGCEVVDIFSAPDANFPHHNPDPEDPHNLRELSQTVVSRKADLGIAFDADGDRLGLVSDTGDVIWGDQLILLFAKEVLKNNQGKKIVYDVKCSSLLQELIPQFGGIPLMHKTGHAPIKDTLRKDKDVIFAGELSGHFYFSGDYFRIDDGLFAAARLLQIISSQPQNVSALFAQFPRTVVTPELKLACPDADKNQVVENVKNIFKGRFQIIEIEGARIIFSPKSWGLIRASNTAPLITIRVEAPSQEEVLEIKNQIADALEKNPQLRGTLDRHQIASHTGALGWV